MMNIESIQYLALEGGGGKGGAYLGAIKILEHYNALPLTNGENNQIKGIAGASAGAITALLLSIGLDTEEIREELKKDFGSFLDAPCPGIYKAILPSEENPGQAVSGYAWDKYKTLPGSSRYLAQVGGFFSDNLSVAKLNGEGMYRNRYGSHILRNFFGVSVALRDIMSKVNNPLVKRMTQNDREFPRYLYNLLYDRGLFPGIQVSEYFIDTLKRYMPVKHPAYFGSMSDEELHNKCKNLTFAHFKQITKVDLVVSAVNNSLGKPVYFSASYTPHFPVVEAVGMSMAIPGVFKPVFNGYNMYTNNSPYAEAVNADYIGLFVDGGTVNNFPIHAFDENKDAKLNKKILGIRLSSGPNPDDKNWKKEIRKKYEEYGMMKEYKEKKHKVEVPGTYRNTDYNMDYPQEITSLANITFPAWLGKLYDSLTYYSENGQIRTNEEKEQVLELFAYTLETLNFTPDKAEKNFTVDAAAVQTLNFLGMGKKLPEALAEPE